LVALLGVGNYMVGLWSLFPPVEGNTVYFWLVRFYDYIFIPSMILFPISMLIILLWFYHLAGKLWVQIFLKTAGVVIFFFCFLFSLAFAMIFPGLTIVGHVEKSGQIYYLVKYYDDLAFDYAFCESDKIGFSGPCKNLAWQVSDAPDPQFYIEQTTGLLTVKFDSPPSTFRISIQPTHIYYELAP
jgi:hypothetical protein